MLNQSSGHNWVINMDSSSLLQLSQNDLVLEALRLQALLEKERKISASYQDELKRVKEQHLTVQSQVEQEEEYITNKLMKRLEQLKKEKQILATEVEQEEEFLTNTLQKKLEKLNREKVDLENRLEVEQEYVVNKLCKQLEQLSAEKAKLHKEKVDLENQLEAEQEYIMNKLQKQLEKLTGEKAGLQRERAELQRQCGELSGAVDKLNRDKVLLESQMEMEEENIVNRLQRQLEQLTASYKALEQKLEARGLTIRDMGLLPNELPPETWASYSRSTSRASSGELSRASWGSMRVSTSMHGNTLHHHTPGAAAAAAGGASPHSGTARGITIGSVALGTHSPSGSSLSVGSAGGSGDFMKVGMGPSGASRRRSDQALPSSAMAGNSSLGAAAAAPTAAAPGGGTARPLSAAAAGSGQL